jgi:hypothetical protein
MIVAADLQVCQKRNGAIEEITADLEVRRHVFTCTTGFFILPDALRQRANRMNEVVGPAF